MSEKEKGIRIILKKRPHFFCSYRDKLYFLSMWA